jgi:hypothetical protein
MRKSIVHNDPLGGNRDQTRSVSVSVTVTVRF